MKCYGKVINAMISNEKGIDYLCLTVEKEDNNVSIGEGPFVYDPGKESFEMKTPAKDYDDPSKFIGMKISWEM